MEKKIKTVPFKGSRLDKEISQLQTALKEFVFREEDFPPLPSVSYTSEDISALALMNKEQNSKNMTPSKGKQSRFFPAPLHCYSNAARIPCWFFEMLPLEVRRHIYYLAMREMGYFDYPLALRNPVKFGSHPRTPKFLPIFCLASKLIREEAIPVYLRHVQYTTVSAYPQNLFLCEFLNSVKHKLAWRAIKALEFNYFSFFPGGENMKNADLELAIQCPGLEKLRITMHLKELWHEVIDHVNEDDQTTRFRRAAKSVKEIVERYHLERIFECDRLSRVEWKGWSFCGEEYAIPGVKQALENLAIWVMEEFVTRKGQNVEMDVAWFQLHDHYDY